MFSCFNDPPRAAGTDALLSLRLLSDGVAMGLRGDDRVTAEGLTYSVEDVREKLDAYVDVVAKSRLSLRSPQKVNGVRASRTLLMKKIQLLFSRDVEGKEELLPLWQVPY